MSGTRWPAWLAGVSARRSCQVSLFARGTGVLASRSAMRVCQPGPVARQRATTSGGRRKLMSCRGLADRGRPPLLTTARASMLSVSSGSFRYSDGLMTCASTRARSEPKVRREAVLLTVVGLSHAEDVANRATRGVADDYEPASEQTEAEDSAFTVVFAHVFDLDGHALEDRFGVREVQASFGQRPFSLGRVERNAHTVSVSTITARCNRSRRHIAASLALHGFCGTTRWKSKAASAPSWSRTGARASCCPQRQTPLCERGVCRSGHAVQAWRSVPRVG
jgi:hypothetical protein